MTSAAKRLARRLLGRPDLIRDVAKLLDVPSPVVLDVGANVGQTAEEVLAAFAAPVVHCFEPSPSSFAELERRFRGRATLNNVAAGDHPGTLPLYSDAQHSVNDSLLAPVHPSDVSATVPVVTIDDYCRDCGIARIDLLKIDTQGYDLRVLAGARGLISSGSVRLLCVEAIANPMYEGQAKPSELFAFAEAHGYRVGGIYPASNWGDRLTSFDILFVLPAAGLV